MGPGIHRSPAVVLGMFETGLAVGRSLGKSGIKVFGLDASKKAGFHSKYIIPSICPHPLDREDAFVEYLVGIAEREKCRPALFIASDEFLLPVSRNRKVLSEYYLSNLPEPEILERIADKSLQHRLAADAGIPVPETFSANDMDQLGEVIDRIPFPAFIKGSDVTAWRKKIGSLRKGYLVHSRNELIELSKEIFRRGAGGLIQEVIPGPDTNHFKASCYLSGSGEVLLAFGLRKLRQYPVGFGFGCLVESVHYPEMLDLGKQLLSKIGYRGVGSVEFKLDGRDGRLKMIEINPRYWQQNALADRCGMNFPRVDYLEMTGERPKPQFEYRSGVKWVNLYSDIESFREYRRQGRLSFVPWIRSLKGEIVFSDLDRSDMIPGIREIVLENIVRRSARFGKRKLGIRPRDSRSVQEIRDQELSSE